MDEQTEAQGCRPTRKNQSQDLNLSLSSTSMFLTILSPFATQTPESLWLLGNLIPVVKYGHQSWTIKKAECLRCFWTVILEKSLESSLDRKEIKPVNPEGNQSWIFIGGTDAEAEAPILWPPDKKSWLTGKDPDAGKDWREKEKRKTEDKMVGWHHRLNGHEFEQAPGDGEGQGSLVCCSPWGHKELDTTEQLNNNHFKQTARVVKNPLLRLLI